MRRLLPTEAEAREILSRRRTRPAPRPAPRAGKALQPLIRKLDAQFGRSASALETRWPEIVGERLARVTQPQKLVKGRGDQPGTLELRVAGAAALLVQHQSEEILSRVNLFLGEGTVGKLRIAQGPVKPVASAANAKPRAARRSLPAAPLPAADEAELKDSLKNVPENLRAALANLGRAALGRTGGKTER